MLLRRNQLSEFAPDIQWLGNGDSKLVFSKAAANLGKFQFRLNPSLFSSVERQGNIGDEQFIREWLARRVGFSDAPLFVVYTDDAVCAVRTSFFLEHWQDLFRSGRDDGIVVPPAGMWALVFWQQHFEFGSKELPIEA